MGSAASRSRDRGEGIAAVKVLPRGSAAAEGRDALLESELKPMLDQLEQRMIKHLDTTVVTRIIALEDKYAASMRVLAASHKRLDEQTRSIPDIRQDVQVQQQELQELHHAVKRLSTSGIIIPEPVSDIWDKQCHWSQIEPGPSVSRGRDH